MVISPRIALAAGLASIPSAGLAEPFVQSITIGHASFAACAFSVLDRTYPTRVRMTELRRSDPIRITLSDAMEMDVRRAGRGGTVEIRSAWSFGGEQFYAQRTWREIQGCLPAGP
ncbi:hypothetical protein [Methylobacterium planeticum]|uniref:Uncharacterized protein n=1 Tax=Methylobacterium planeticum TaxID=2615211 RepID=A0A6N6MML2_9HYPH|nr:hypothetical protein [Methylobacterium planeticum]KAB1072474.1 hypothetical protein F6X51_15915 [Methylobacterium planeticum]